MMQLHAQLAWHARLGLECPIVHFKSGWAFLPVWAFYARFGLLWQCGPIMAVWAYCGREGLLCVWAYYGRVGLLCPCWPFMAVWA